MQIRGRLATIAKQKHSRSATTCLSAYPHGIAVRLIWHVKHTVLHMPNHALKESEIPIISDSVKARTKATRSGNSLKLEVQWTSNASFVSERAISASTNCTSVPKQTESDTSSEKEYTSRTSRHKSNLTNTNTFAIVFTYHHFEK